MSKALLPVKVDPRKCADQRLVYKGVVDFAQMPRLQSYLLDGQGETRVQLDFGVDEEGVRHLHGQATTAVQMLCQRCLEPVMISLQAEFSHAFAVSETDAERIPVRYDAWVVDEDGKHNLHEAVEEELILSLPLIPQHEDCEIRTTYEDPRDSGAGAGKPNPFAVLAQLKVNKR